MRGNKVKEVSHLVSHVRWWRLHLSLSWPFCFCKKVAFKMDNILLIIVILAVYVLFLTTCVDAVLPSYLPSLSQRSARKYPYSIVLSFWITSSQNRHTVGNIFWDCSFDIFYFTHVLDTSKGNMLIEDYFRQGFQYAEIAAFLNLCHEITVR